MTSFFYVVSIAYHTSVQRFGSAWIPLEKKVFWLRAQPLMHRLLHLFIGPERLSSRRLFEWSKDMRVTGVRSGEYGGYGRTDLGLLQQLNGQYGAEHCHVATKHLYSEVRVFWTLLHDADDSLGDLRTLHCSQCSPLGM